MQYIMNFLQEACVTAGFNTLNQVYGTYGLINLFSVL